MCQRTDILLREGQVGDHGAVYCISAAKRNVNIPCNLPKSRCGVYTMNIFFDPCSNNACVSNGPCNQLKNMVNNNAVKQGSLADKIKFVNGVYAGLEFTDIPVMKQGDSAWRKTDELMSGQ